MRSSVSVRTRDGQRSVDVCLVTSAKDVAVLYHCSLFLSLIILNKYSTHNRRKTCKCVIMLSGTGRHLQNVLI